MTETLEECVRRQLRLRLEQGLPPLIEDEGVLDLVADIWCSVVESREHARHARPSPRRRNTKAREK